MTTKYRIVDKAPDKINSGEIVISIPEFREEIGKARHAGSRRGFMTANYARTIISDIGNILSGLRIV